MQSGDRPLLQPSTPPVVVDGLSERELHHVSAMVPRLGWAVRLFGWIFFLPVEFSSRTQSELAGVAKEGAVVFAMNAISQLDYLYFNWIWNRHKLPRSHFANGITMRLFQPWRTGLWRWFRRAVLRRAEPRDEEVLHGLLRRQLPVTVFLRRSDSLLDALTDRPELNHLRELIEAQRAMETPVLIVPQVLVWHRDPDRSKSSIIDEFFGDPNAPGRARKLLSFLLNHRRAKVRVAQPISLQKFLADNQVLRDDVLLADRLRADIEAALRTEQRVIRGAPIKSNLQLFDEVLAHPEVEADVQRLATETAKPAESVRTEMRANLDEIAAKYSMNMVSAFSFGLTLLWARIYEGMEVDEEGLERIRQAGRTAPLVMVGSHKSHIDYLIISYVFYRYGLIPPHIAAGANLAFFPLGPIFRRAGAFFLRRTFSGQPIYAAAFRHYFRKLLADGHWLEFFPEGGRSRTGKLLPPKFGLIKLVLEAVADGRTEDVWFIPTNFGYERLIEEKAYRKELEGGEKKAESPVEVLKATRVLVHKYGRIRVQFGEAMSVRQLLAEQGALAPAETRDPEAFERALKVCGYAILGRINEAAVVTPTALTAAVLLTKIQKGIARADLLLRIGYLLDLATRRGAVLSEPLVTAIRVKRQAIGEAEARDQARHEEAGHVPDPFGLQSERARAVGEAVAEVMDKALQLFESAQWILRRPFDNEDVFIVRGEGRLHLDYYKNNVLHLFVPDALLAAAILALLHLGPTMRPERLADLTKFLSRLLKFEFVYPPGVSFDAQYNTTLEDFLRAGWLVQRGDGDLTVTTNVRGALRLYAKLLQNFIESYALMARALPTLAKAPMTEKAFLDLVQTEAHKAYDLGDVECYEAISKVNLGNALKIFIEQKIVVVVTEQHGKKRVKMLTVPHSPTNDALLEQYRSQITQLHAPWRLDPL